MEHSERNTMFPLDLIGAKSPRFLAVVEIRTFYGVLTLWRFRFTEFVTRTR